MARGVELLVAAAGLMLVVSVPLVTAQLPAFVANAICAPGSTDCTSCLNLRTATLVSAESRTNDSQCVFMRLCIIRYRALCRKGIHVSGATLRPAD